MSTTALWILITFAIFFPLGCYLGYKSGRLDESMHRLAEHSTDSQAIDDIMIPQYLLDAHAREVAALREESAKLAKQLAAINDKLSNNN